MITTKEQPKPDASPRIFSHEFSVLVSNRPYEEVLNTAGLEEQHLHGKRVLSVGEGLSDFVLHLNRHKLCRAIGIDPVYGALRGSTTFDDFAKKAMRLGLMVVPDPERFKRIKKAIKTGTHLSFTSYDPLPFPDENFDVIVASMVCAPFNNDVFTSQFYENFGQMSRILKPNGYFCAGKSEYAKEHYPKTRHAFRQLEKHGWISFRRVMENKRWLYFAKEPSLITRDMPDAQAHTFT